MEYASVRAARQGRAVGPYPDMSTALTMKAEVILVNALLVGASDEMRLDLGRTLRGRGWSVATCAGPAAASCPMLYGGPCLLRKRTDVAVVFVNSTADPDAVVLPKLHCAGAPSSPYVLVLEGRMDGPQERLGGTVIGSTHGAVAIADTIESLQ